LFLIQVVPRYEINADGKVAFLAIDQSAPKEASLPAWPATRLSLFKLAAGLCAGTHVWLGIPAVSLLVRGSRDISAEAHLVPVLCPSYCTQHPTLRPQSFELAFFDVEEKVRALPCLVGTESCRIGSNWVLSERVTLNSDLHPHLLLSLTVVRHRVTQCLT
jgi:hypothetical protein